MNLLPAVFLLVLTLAAAPVPLSRAPTSKTPSPPLTMGEVLVWMDSGEESQRVAQLVERQGIDFAPTAEFLEMLRRLHAKPVLLEKLQNTHPRALAANPAQEQAAYAHLLACLQDGRTETSAGENKECIAAESGEPSTAHFALGRRALSARQLTAAQQFFKGAIEAEPSIPENHNYLGFALQEAGDLKTAEAEYHEAMRLDSGYETPVSNLASLALGQNDLEQAERYARQAVAMPYASAMAHQHLGIALIKQSKVHEGMSELYEAARIEPESPVHHVQIAEMLLAGHVYELALEQYQQAAALDPSNAQTHRRILEVLLVLRRGQEALAECERLSKLVPLREGRSCKDIVRRGQVK